MDQSARIAELDRFKQGDVTILVASDVAARGLDIKGVSHVVNFDAPWHPDDYVHRIGRTGRAGATGVAYTFVTDDDAENVANIQKLTGQKIPVLDMGQAPAPVAEAEAPVEAPRRARRARPAPVEAPVEAEAPVAAPEPVAPEPVAATPPAARRERDERPRRTDRRDERPARTPRYDERPRYEDRNERPARYVQQDAPEDGGWNGPVPAFLSVRLTG